MMKKFRIIDREEKKNIAAIMYEPEKTCKYILIVCHGFRGAKENSGNLAPFAQRLIKMGIGVLAFDFTGCGESEGDFKYITLSRQADDLKLVIDYVYSNYKLPILLLGRSFGGTTVLAGGSDDERVSGYILWSTPVYLEDTFAKSLQGYYRELAKGYEVNIERDSDSFQLVPGFIADFNHHDMEKYIIGLGDRPVLVVQGLDDQTVDPANAEGIYKRCRNAWLELVPGADHRFSGRTIERDNLTIEWIKEHFKI